MSARAANVPNLSAARAHAYENPRPEVQALVPLQARRILDLGCSSGTVGAALKARQGAEVVGIEIDEQYASVAASRLDRVIRRDLDEMFGDTNPSAESLGSFDCLIAADVLEHLRDPWAVLRHAAHLLEPEGHAVISLPNVRHWRTFYELGVKGTWPLKDTGLFDRAHLRWFTLADARQLLDQAALDLVEVEPRFRLRTEDAGHWKMALTLLRRGRLRSVLAFQYVLLARTHAAV